MWHESVIVNDRRMYLTYALQDTDIEVCSQGQACKVFNSSTDDDTNYEQDDLTAAFTTVLREDNNWGTDVLVTLITDTRNAFGLELKRGLSKYSNGIEIWFVEEGESFFLKSFSIKDPSSAISESYFDNDSTLWYLYNQGEAPVIQASFSLWESYLVSNYTLSIYDLTDSARPKILDNTYTVFRMQYMDENGDYQRGIRSVIVSDTCTGKYLGHISSNLQHYLKSAQSKMIDGLVYNFDSQKFTVELSIADAPFEILMPKLSQTFNTGYRMSFTMGNMVGDSCDCIAALQWDGNDN